MAFEEIDIDDLLAEGSPEVLAPEPQITAPLATIPEAEVISTTELVPAPITAVQTADFTGPAPDIITLKGRLELWQPGCRDLFLDLTTATFHASAEDMYLECPREYYSKRLFFKADPQNPHDVKVLHAQKQFCKMLGVPHSFFMANRPTLKENIVRTWQAGLRAMSGKAECTVRLREGGDCSMIRALLPLSTAYPLNRDLIGTLIDSVKVPLSLEFSHGDEKDDLVLHARFLFDKEYQLLGHKVCLGFSLITSELGASPLIVETLLHDKESKTSFVASYGGSSFFKSKGDGIQPNEVKELFPKIVERLEKESLEMIQYVEARAQGKQEFNLEEEFAEINRIRGLPKNFRRAIFHELTERKEDIQNIFDVAIHMSLVAKDFDITKRIVVERAAGVYLTLTFGRD